MVDSNNRLVLGLLGGVLLIAFLGTWFLVRNKTSTDLFETPAGVALVVEDGSYLDELGNEVSLFPITTNYLVVTSWASWSPFTGADLEATNRLAKEFDSEDIKFIFINRAEPLTQAKRGLAGLDTSDLKLSLVYDPSDHFYQSIGGYAMPETIVFERNGQVVLHERRQLSYEDLKALLDGLIN